MKRKKTTKSFLASCCGGKAKTKKGKKLTGRQKMRRKIVKISWKWLRRQLTK